jgi:hypothetical protein
MRCGFRPLMAALGLLGGCSGTPSAPVAATVQVILTSPYTDDGGVLFTVTGGRVDSVSAGGYTLFSSRPDPGTLEVIVTGNLSPGILATLYLPDERLLPEYSVTLNQAAARLLYTERNPAGYSISLKP